MRKTESLLFFQPSGSALPCVYSKIHVTVNELCVASCRGIESQINCVRRAISHTNLRHKCLTRTNTSHRETKTGLCARATREVTQGQERTERERDGERERERGVEPHPSIDCPHTHKGEKDSILSNNYLTFSLA